jgi:HEAT repeat protein
LNTKTHATIGASMKLFCAPSALLLLGMAMAGSCLAGPISGEEAKRQNRVLEQLKKSLGEETTDAAKFTVITRVMKEERNADLRRRILSIATQIPGSDLEKFLLSTLNNDEDAGLRGQAATTLGLVGSEKCLAPLAHTAGNDPTTGVQMGDVGGQSSARRPATFAIAELAARFPKLADEAADKLRALKVADDAKDNEGLADARAQALYQITRDDALLKPFRERLQSKDVKERERGVVAFQYFKLKEAPPEIVNALKDTNSGVRSWAALVLGRIGDTKTGAVLMAVAADSKEDTSVRCNAIGSLGYVKAADAAELMEKLLNDPADIIQANAAITLYRITGKKVKQFPEGYKVD